MITSFFISPHPSLQPFVDSYILSTSNAEYITFKSYWPASNETSLIFYMADQPGHLIEHDSSILSGKKNCVVGPLTRHNGIVHFNGRYHTFIIQFKANGFHKIFRPPMHEFADKVFIAEDVFGKPTGDLHNQLQNTEDIHQMALFADSFLLTFLNRNKGYIAYDGITTVSQKLYNTTQLFSVVHYAYTANMSVRNFERRFTEQVGISPKLYTKLVRFNEAVKIKIVQPEKSWTSIACECGYFDQMHFIKDFKKLAGLNPGNFFLNSVPFNISETEMTQPGDSIPDLINNHLPEQKSVFIKRTAF